jgi:hypothetical protein
VRRTVIVELHRDHDPEEPADGWHDFIVPSLPVANPRHANSLPRSAHRQTVHTAALPCHSAEAEVPCDSIEPVQSAASERHQPRLPGRPRLPVRPGDAVVSRPLARSAPVLAEIETAASTRAAAASPDRCRFRRDPTACRGSRRQAVIVAARATPFRRQHRERDCASAPTRETMSRRTSRSIIDTGNRSVPPAHQANEWSGACPRSRR